MEILVTRASSIGPRFIFRSPVHHYGDHGDHHHELLHNDIHVLHNEFHFLGASEMGHVQGQQDAASVPKGSDEIWCLPSGNMSK